LDTDAYQSDFQKNMIRITTDEANSVCLALRNKPIGKRFLSAIIPKKYTFANICVEIVRVLSIPDEIMQVIHEIDIEKAEKIIEMKAMKFYEREFISYNSLAEVAQDLGVMDGSSADQQTRRSERSAASIADIHISQ
jgi:hypothetical protein